MDKVGKAELEGSTKEISMAQQQRGDDVIMDDGKVCESTGREEDDGGGNKFRYRESLPRNQISREDFSIWNFLRGFIGKDLSKITMPVILNEPLSLIQRLSEKMEYSCLINEASKSDDPLKRLEYITTFAVAAISPQYRRLGKTFNPLLGETFEYRREDLGFHWMSEQVSHHPPVSAFCALGTDDDHPFEFRGCCDPKISFRGKYVNVETRACCVLDLKNRNESYSWKNPSLSVHNIVIGSMWMEHHGTIEVHNLKSKEKCVVQFKSSGWFSSTDINKIEGTMYNSNGEKVRMLLGDWTESLHSLNMDGWKKYQDVLASIHKTDKYLSKTETKENTLTPMQRALLQLEADELCDCRCLWKANRRPSNSNQMYNMTKFAMSINQPDVDGYQIAPTDSRKRPDIRMLENGDIDAASSEKERLEEKQRAARKVRSKQKQEWTSRWFEKTKHPQTKSDDWKLYADKFHKRVDWSACPDIF